MPVQKIKGKTYAYWRMSRLQQKAGHTSHNDEDYEYADVFPGEELLLSALDVLFKGSDAGLGELIFKVGDDHHPTMRWTISYDFLVSNMGHNRRMVREEWAAFMFWVREHHSPDSFIGKWIRNLIRHTAAEQYVQDKPDVRRRHAAEAQARGGPPSRQTKSLPHCEP